MDKKYVSNLTKILGIVIALVHLIGLYVFISKGSNLFEYSSSDTIGIVVFITNIILVVTCIGFIISGIGIFKFMEWARKLTIWLAIIAILNNIARTINVMLMMKTSGFYYSYGPFSRFLPFMFYIALIYIFTRKEVREQFK